MTEHYTRWTVSVTAHCRKCGKDTTHRVDNGRRGPCLACIERGPKAAEPKKKSRAAILKEQRLLNEARLAASPLRAVNPEFQAGIDRTVERIRVLMNSFTIDTDDFDENGNPTDDAVFKLADLVYEALLKDDVPPEFGFFTENPVPVMLSMARDNLKRRCLKERKKQPAKQNHSAGATLTG